MRTERYIRFIVAMLMLLLYGAGDAWALDENDILIQVMPSGTESKGSVTASEGSVSASVDGRVVTLTVTPGSDYKTKKDLIVAEKMINPTDRSNAPRRAPGIGAFNVEGSTDDWVTASTTYTFTIPTEYDGAYVTVTFVSTQINEITSLSDLQNMTAGASYRLARDIDASGLTTSLDEFTGILDGNYHKILNLGVPLFSSVNGGTVKNITFEDVNISESGDAGTVTPLATGAARIYNCGILPTSTNYDNDGNITGFTGSSVRGTGNVGGLVGKLEGTARVINCYSYANIEGGNTVGGIVGNNSETTTAASAANLKTMVMNCMFYGDITGGSSKAPIYNGTIITNVDKNKGVSNFNYFWSGASYVKEKDIDVYNCALAAETRFLQRFEFFRHLLNSNRELAAWWVKGSDGQKSDMAKWVQEPSQIGSNIPFPILKEQGYYPSVVNIDADNVESIDANNEHRNEGRKLTNMGTNGTLAVTIRMGAQGTAPDGQPTGAGIKSGQTFPINLTITDKDTLHYNFNYGKVQLPYYNDYCEGNYTGERVVTGWKIVSISGGTAGTYTSGDDVTFDSEGNLTKTPYNFADRKCTDKDLYSKSGRIFNQGAYWDVPDGVTAITIEPYWGKAVYLSDAYYDVVYNSVMETSYDVTNVGGGQRYENGQKYNLVTRGRDDTNGQIIYTSMTNAVDALNPSGTVYDNAVVLVGNYHQYNGINGDNKPYTVTSIDLDGDNEPDYSLMLRFNGRTAFHPVRYDFLNLIGLGMAQKSTGGKGSYNLGIMQPKYWFEVTNTALFRVTQFEYSPSGRNKQPIILQGGVIEQWVTQQQSAGDAVEYFHIGGNVWFKEFHRGSHQDNAGKSTPHPPVSVTGGDFDKFYLTGLYQSQAAIYDDNAECYISGGRFGEVAGAGMEGIGTSNGKGNVTWVIDRADIREFYGGGINAAKPVHGNIHTVIRNSYVTMFCGGPKFGNMEESRTVKTIADNCTFGTYFGAGYGGNSYNRYAPTNKNAVINIDWNAWVTSEYKQEYNATYKGVSTQIDYQFIPVSDNKTNVARLWVEFVAFSLASTHDVTSSLTGCKVLGNFYGGGSLGKVDGNATSTLKDCTVLGSAFGAGYSATLPTVEVMPMQFITEPYYDENSGSFTAGVVPSKSTTPPTVTYKWEHRDETINSTTLAVNKTDTILYTNEDLTALGTVTGKATINIEGSTTVGGSVYGGGEESGVDGSTEVIVASGTIGAEGQGGVEYGNVYGGGKGKRDKVSAGLVKGNTKVTISNGTIYHNVYGGGAYGSVGDFDYDAVTGLPTGLKTGAAANSGKTEVYITGGTFGWNGKENGMVFGSSRGDVGAPGDIEDRMAWVYDTRVVVGDTTENATSTTAAPIIKGSVYGGGENGHNLHDSYVRINGGTIGIAEGTPVTSGGVEYAGAAYPYRGNVYGGGCGTDMYYADRTKEKYDGNGDLYNPLAGVVRSNAVIEITGGLVVRNVFGAGAMGSVGTAGVATTGKTTINVSGGTIGVDGSDETGDGNVYGAARGDLAVTDDGFAEVRETDLTVSGGTVKGSVYGGGDAGDVNENTSVSMSGGTVLGNLYGGGNKGYVGTFTTEQTETGGINYEWQTINDTKTGICRVNMTGGIIGSEDVSSDRGNVFGGGKGLANTFQCEKAMVDSTNVSISAGTIYGSVYGGGEIARMERHTAVTIGEENAVGEGFAPDIKGNVFGAGKGLATHGYSALVRGNTKVIIQGKAKIGKSVYGGGEIASVGKYVLNSKNMPVSLVSDGLGICNVTVRGNAKIGPDNTGHVFGGGKGIEPVWSETDKPQRMTIINGQSDWETFATENDYLTYVQTLALATQTDVTVEGNAAVNGSVYGGSESGFVQHHTNVTVQGNSQIGAESTEGNVYGGGLGLEDWNQAGSVSGNTTLNIKGGTTYGSVFGGGAYGFVKQSVAVNIEGGTIKKDVYGGGALADTNTENWDSDKDNGEGGWAENHTSASQTTTVNLKGGTLGGDAYGGGLGRLASGAEGQPGYVAPVAAMVYGNVTVNQGTANDDTAPATAYTITYLNTTDVQKDGEGNPIADNDGNPVYVKVVNSGRIFGCNNLNGTPKGNVTVTVNRTVTGKDGEGNDIVRTAITRNETTKEVESVADTHTYEVAAVYGGGNLANYVPTEGKVQVIINSCDVSIEEVYGGGNAAKVPSTDVTVNGAHEIERVFGGGNGKDKYTLDGGTTWNVNPGADIDGYANTMIKGGYVHEAYGGSNEKGTISGSITIDMGKDGCAGCPVKVDKLVGAGKNADVNNDLIMILGCQNSTKIPIVYGGADNANVRGNVELTITSGNFGKVFGGNNLGGSIFGHICLNIEETSECEPIRIDELYLGGNQATYSRYGYYQTGTDANDRPIYKPRTSALDENKPIQLDGTEYATIDAFTPYDEPELNVISCTRIGEVFGGGYGVGGDMYANPTVNLNMIPGYHAEAVLGGADKLGEIGDVYGGGNAADVAGNTTVNIGTESTVHVKSWEYNGATGTYTPADQPVKGANITGNVYGGGKLANVGQYHTVTNEGVTTDEIDAVGSTLVNICAKYNESTKQWDAVAEGESKVRIAGHVYGGGKGEATDGVEGAFRCGKAMVTGETNVHIGNGTINENVYGGGEVGRVESNTTVMIGAESGTTTPVVEGNVYGAGKGVRTHGYSALVRGNTYVTVQGDAKVGNSVYGGGEIGSVGKYNVATKQYHESHPEVLEGMPYSLENAESGICNVVVRGNAEIGPDGMQMTKDGGPDDAGYVFGGGKGVIPFEGYETTENPWRVLPNNTRQFFSADSYEEYYGFNYNTAEHNYEADYFRFVESLALITRSDVTIGGNAFVKGSVYGGSFNGHVQQNTHVTIADDCQIGQGEGTTQRYSELYGTWPTTTENISTSWPECAHWLYDPSSGAPYDKYAIYQNPTDGKFYYDAAFNQTSEGASHIAKDGHTYYGNVFGGGSGSIPYAPGKWHRGAGSVGGNTQIDITGGHILTSVYGGNEMTDVGNYVKDNDGQNTTTPAAEPYGKCTINMTGGTVGVPRTKADKEAHPVVGNIYGAGKGDQRIFFNTWTNVVETEINITGDARVYGSVFGGGEDGHVMYDTETNIGTVTIDDVSHSATDNLIIGTTGTSYYDGNVFGGGRGFSGEAQTAGTVGGNVRVNISGGKMLGNVYGGGRLASVGTQFTQPEDDDYGNFQEDGDKTYGHVAVNISGGKIGLDTGSQVSGNVFGGSMGRLTLLNGSLNPIWPKMAQVKTASVTISANADIRRNVYGGSELGTVRENDTITIDGGTIEGSVYGGGFGSNDNEHHTPITIYWGQSHQDYLFTPMQWAGCVGGDTFVKVNGGTVKQNVYGGGEMASVGIIDYRITEDAEGEFTYNDKKYAYSTIRQHHNIVNEGQANEMIYDFSLSWPYEFTYVPCVPTETEPRGKATVEITDGRIGGSVYGGGKGEPSERYAEAFLANVRETEVRVNYTSTPESDDGSTTNCIAQDVYGGGENGHVMENAKLTISGGLVGHSAYGSGKGTDQFTTQLRKCTDDEPFTGKAYSVTAGKVYGNASVEMTGGRVNYNVYGGGKLASIGKGNYSGGTDDYAPMGYGETLNEKLWESSANFDPTQPVSSTNKPVSFADHFLSSGKATVEVTGGTVGTPDGMDGNMPTGNVFGGSQGEAAPNIFKQPAHLYNPVFHVANINEAEVTIGKQGEAGPRIYGSVYGGGQDGHMRRDAKVTVYSGEIGNAYTSANQTAVGTDDVTDPQWQFRGNVFGAGSGFGEYELDYDGNGVIDEEKKYTYQYPDATGAMHTETFKEKGVSFLAGCVARFTEVNIQGGTIHRNVYGGGSVAGTGEPKFGGQTYEPYRKGDTTDGHGVGKQSMSEVNISGGTIGEANYGGDVYGASRGDESLLTADSRFTTSIWADVNISGGTIYGDVYGGGELGAVKQDTKVNLLGGEIKGDAYGGGKGTASVQANIGSDFGTGGNTTVELNKNVTGKGCIVSRIFGANNVNGSPKGNVMVHVYGTQNKNTDAILSKVPLTFNEPETEKLDYWSTQASTIGLTPATIIDGEKTDEENIDLLKAAIEASRYDVEAVYGGGDQAAYIPTTPWDGESGSKSQVIIEGCSETSIETVYGGGNAAPVPETNVRILEAYEIQSVFGGGNGKDNVIINGVSSPNPGADVGEYKDASGEAVTYGTGAVNLSLKGGYMHEAYGGSNEKGKIKGRVNIDTNPEGDCELIVEKLVGAGKNADIDGDLIMILGCKPTTKTPLIFAGADNADVNGNVELTITSGTFGRVFGGNNLGGAIKGHLVLNIEETGCNPINIEELYLGGYEAPYSIYGYYQPIDPETHQPQVDANEKPVLLPRTAADHAITDTSDPNYKAPYGNPAEDDKHPFPYKNPVLNVVSATHIGQVFGGGLGEKAVMHADPIVNISMIKGTPNGVESSSLGTIGDVFGGGNEAAVTGSTTVNIATEATVQLHELIKPDGEYQLSDPIAVEGANITGNVYGGGNEADVKVNTTVNIAGGSVGGNVYGGGNLGYVGSITSEQNETGGTDYLWATGTGVTNVNISGGSVGPENMDPTTVKNLGNVFGAGKGKDDSFECEKAMVSTTNVTITNGAVRGSVYGGGEIGRVEHNAVVTIGEADVETSTPDIRGNVFGGGAGLKTHGYSALVRGNSTVTVQGKATVGLNVYGGGEIASVGKYKVKKSNDPLTPADAPADLPIGMPYSLVSDNLGISIVTVKDGAEITGNLFGAGKGQEPEELDWTTVAGDKTAMPRRMMNNYPQKNTYWDWYDEDRGIIWEYFDTETKYQEFIETLALTTQTFVNVDENAKVKGDVYGGSESGFVQHHTDVTIQGSSEIGHINGTTVTGGNVFGGGLGLATYSEAGRVSGDTKLHINGGTMHKSVYGGGAYGLVRKNVTVDIAGGTVDYDVYGGGALAHTNTENPDGVTDQYVTAVNLKGGTVGGAAYGGALGRMEVGTEGQEGYVAPVAAIVHGNVTVELNKNNGTCQIDTVFGGNNINGTPKGHSLVHIFKTVPKTGQDENGYDVTAVFGGGNASDYEPAATDEKQSTEVIVEGCDLSSIETVYGGGYGAAVPATSVLIRGSKIIDKVFGGGYGEGENNPGANVGYKTGGAPYTDGSGNALGSGKAIVQLMGGTIHYVYGGSNTKGDIREGSSVTNVDQDGLDGCCDYLKVDEIYGGGRSADMFGGTEIVLSCMPDDWVGAIYAGAESADVENDVSLTLTSGKFGRVFGGNKSGGKIDGSITINLEENPECDTPLIIGEVYGGGNEAAYSAYGYRKDDTTNRWVPLQAGEAGAAEEPFAGPWVNAKAFTSIGNIYGGGYGSTATVVANPRVLINEVQDGTDNLSATGITNRNYAGEAKELPHGTGTMHVQLYPHVAGKMGVIGNVFGGGNAAKVIGDTSVEIGLGDTRYNEGGKAKVFFESLKDDPATTDVDERIKTVAGADIRGNVYGGGNQAEVTGNANVQIGKAE